MEYWVLVGGKGYLAKDASMAMDMLDYYSFLSQAFACVEGGEKRLNTDFCGMKRKHKAP